MGMKTKSKMIHTANCCNVQPLGTHTMQMHDMMSRAKRRLPQVRKKMLLLLLLLLLEEMRNLVPRKMQPFSYYCHSCMEIERKLSTVMNQR